MVDHVLVLPPGFRIERFLPTCPLDHFPDGFLAIGRVEQRLIRDGISKGFAHLVVNETSEKHPATSRHMSAKDEQQILEIIRTQMREYGLQRDQVELLVAARQFR